MKLFHILELPRSETNNRSDDSNALQVKYLKGENMRVKKSKSETGNIKYRSMVVQWLRALGWKECVGKGWGEIDNKLN